MEGTLFINKPEKKLRSALFKAFKHDEKVTWPLFFGDMEFIVVTISWHENLRFEWVKIGWKAT